MIFIKKHKDRRRPVFPQVSAQEDIARLLDHDWSDPLLDRHFALVVERLNHKAQSDQQADQGEESESPPLSTGRGAR